MAQGGVDGPHPDTSQRYIGARPSKPLISLIPHDVPLCYGALAPESVVVIAAFARPCKQCCTS